MEKAGSNMEQDPSQVDWSVYNGWVELLSKSRLYWDKRYIRIRQSVVSFYKDDRDDAMPLFSFQLTQDFVSAVAPPTKEKFYLLDVYNKKGNIQRYKGLLGGLSSGLSNGRRALLNTASFTASLATKAVSNVVALIGLGGNNTGTDADEEDDDEDINPGKFSGLRLALEDAATLEILMIVFIQSINGELRASEHFDGDVSMNYHAGETLNKKANDGSNQRKSLLDAMRSEKSRPRGNSSDISDSDIGCDEDARESSKAKYSNTKRVTAEPGMIRGLLSGIGDAVATVVTAPVNWAGKRFGEERKSEEGEPMQLPLTDLEQPHGRTIGRLSGGSRLNDQESLDYIRNFALPVDHKGQPIKQKMSWLASSAPVASDSEIVDGTDVSLSLAALLQEGSFKRLMVVVYENERFLPIAGFTKKNLIFGDPHGYSDWSGLHRFPCSVLERAVPPPGYRWCDVCEGWKITTDPSYLYQLHLDSSAESGELDERIAEHALTGGRLSPTMSSRNINCDSIGRLRCDSIADSFAFSTIDDRDLPTDLLLAANSNEGTLNGDSAERPRAIMSNQSMRRASLRHVRKRLQEEQAYANTDRIENEESETTTRGQIYKKEVGSQPWGLRTIEMFQGWIYAHRWNRFDVHLQSKNFHFTEGKKDIVRRRRLERMCVKIEE